MKKIISLFVVALAYMNSVFAQTDEIVITWPMVAAEAKKTDASITNPKKAEKTRTWTERGRKYLEVYDFDMKGAFPSMSEADVMLYMKSSPKSQNTEGEYSVQVFDRISLYFKDGKLLKYERTESAKEMFPEKTTPIDIAAEAYIKAKETDIDGKRGELIATQLQKIIDYYTNEGYYYYLQEDYDSAAVYFAKLGDILALEYDNNTKEKRAELLGDCGTMAKAAKKYDEAIKYYNLALTFNPNAKVETYGNIMYCQKMNNDTTAAIQTLNKIIETYPNDENIVDYTTELINFYIQLNQFDKALTYLTQAIEKEPNNSNFLFNIGYLYETSGETEKAIESYTKAISINPKDEGSNLNLGLIYIGQAKKVLEEADAAWGTKNYPSLSTKGKDLLKKAYPFIEVYAEVTKEDSAKANAYNDLASIYTQLEMTKDSQRCKDLRDALK